jgi:hypothetical protein
VRVFHHDRDIVLENRLIKCAKRSGKAPGVAFFLATCSWPGKKKYLVREQRKKKRIEALLRAKTNSAHW